MSLFKVFDIASSAMTAQTLRLNVVASNIANAESVASSEKQVYRAKHPVFSTVMDSLNPEGVSAGVKVKEIVESKAPLRSEFRPDHPLADEKGFVHMPNVNVIEEMANMVSSSRSYQTNTEVINTAKQMLLRTLNLGQ